MKEEYVAPREYVDALRASYAKIAEKCGQDCNGSKCNFLHFNNYLIVYSLYYLNQLHIED